MSSRYDTSPSEDELLPNKLGLTDQDAINEEEAAGFLRTEQAALEVLDGGTVFSLRYLYDLHAAALGHLYDFEPLTQGDNPARYITAVQQAANKDYAPMKELFGELRSRTD